MILIPASTERQNGCCINGGMRVKSKGSTRNWENSPPPTLEVDQGGRPRRETTVDGTSTARVRRWSSFEVRSSSRWGINDQHRERIGHSFAIASKEVTVEQFQRFLKENPRVQVKNYEPIVLSRPAQ